MKRRRGRRPDTLCGFVFFHVGGSLSNRRAMCHFDGVLQ
jgi:hypothetical protein